MHPTAVLAFVIWISAILNIGLCRKVNIWKFGEDGGYYEPITFDTVEELQKKLLRSKIFNEYFNNLIEKYEEEFCGENKIKATTTQTAADSCQLPLLCDLTEGTFGNASVLTSDIAEKLNCHESEEIYIVRASLILSSDGKNHRFFHCRNLLLRPNSTQLLNSSCQEYRWCDSADGDKYSSGLNCANLTVHAKYRCIHPNSTASQFVDDNWMFAENGLWYKLFDNAANYSEAKRSCRSQNNGRLAFTAMDECQIESLKNDVIRKFWLGGEVKEATSFWIGPEETTNNSRAINITTVEGGVCYCDQKKYLCEACEFLHDGTCYQALLRAAFNSTNAEELCPENWQRATNVIGLDLAEFQRYLEKIAPTETLWLAADGCMLYSNFTVAESTTNDRLTPDGALCELNFSDRERDPYDAFT